MWLPITLNTVPPVAGSPPAMTSVAVPTGLPSPQLTVAFQSWSLAFGSGSTNVAKVITPVARSSVAFTGEAVAPVRPGSPTTTESVVVTSMPPVSLLSTRTVYAPFWLKVWVPLTVTTPAATAIEPSDVGDPSPQSMIAEKSDAVAAALASVNEETAPVNGTPSVWPAMAGWAAAAVSAASAIVAVLVVAAVVGVEPAAPPSVSVTRTVTA